MEFQSSKKIAILGAGPSGLVAAKEALANGLFPTIFEKEAQLGGIWNPSTGSVWNTMHTNISKFTTSFGDTPWPPATEMFPSSNSMFQYLTDYANKWNLSNIIKFKATVVKVQSVDLKSRGANGWVVHWNSHGDTSSPELNSEVFDSVIVATGIFAKPHIPHGIPGMETFPGRVLHSKEYKAGTSFEGQRVLVVGGSLSGVEISGDVANYAKEVIHSFRSPFWILKRYVPDISRNLAQIPVDLLLFTRKFYANQDPNDLKVPPPLPEVFKSKNDSLLALCQEQQEFEALHVHPEALTTPIKIVISDQYLNKVRDGRITPRRENILEIQGSQVNFEGGDVQEVDIIIFATGFQVGDSIFDQEIQDLIGYDEADRFQPFILFNASMHPDISNLFFVGMCNSTYFSTMEQQARWACRVLSGRVKLPLREFIFKGLEIEKGIRDQRPRPQYSHPETVYFADGIAKCGHSFPDVKKLGSGDWSLADSLGGSGFETSKLLEEKKKEIFRLFMTQPVTPAHYNLVDDPLDTLNQMELVEQVLKQYEDLNSLI